MARVYLDTSVTIALANPIDGFHTTSTKFIDELRKRGVRAIAGPALLLEVGKAVEIRGTQSAGAIVKTVEENGIELGRPDYGKLFELSEQYLKKGIVPGRSNLDALHYAGAVLLDCSHLASWDKNHFNNRFQERVNKENLRLGFTTLIVGDPLDIISRL